MLASLMDAGSYPNSSTFDPKKEKKKNPAEKSRQSILEGVLTALVSRKKDGWVWHLTPAPDDECGLGDFFLHLGPCCTLCTWLTALPGGCRTPEVKVRPGLLGQQPWGRMTSRPPCRLWTKPRDKPSIGHLPAGLLHSWTLLTVAT